MLEGGKEEMGPDFRLERGWSISRGKTAKYIFSTKYDSHSPASVNKVS